MSLHPHMLSITSEDAAKVRDWLASPNGSLDLGRVALEAVEGGGVWIRIRPWVSS